MDSVDQAATAVPHDTEEATLDAAATTPQPDTTEGDSSTVEQREGSQRQNRGRRQPNRQEDSMKGQKVYRVKTDGAEDGDNAGDAATEETSKRPKTTRNRRAAAEDQDNGAEESKGAKTRARSRSSLQPPRLCLSSCGRTTAPSTPTARQ